MNSYHKISPNSLCRVCLAQNTRVVDIFTTRLHDVLERLTCIPLIAGDGFPHSVCYLCEAQLLKCYKLRAKAITADRILKRLVHAGSIVSEDMENVDRNNLKLNHNLCISSMELESYTSQEIGVQDKAVQYKEPEVTSVTVEPTDVIVTTEKEVEPDAMPDSEEQAGIEEQADSEEQADCIPVFVEVPPREESFQEELVPDAIVEIDEDIVEVLTSGPGVEEHFASDMVVDEEDNVSVKIERLSDEENEIAEPQRSDEKFLQNLVQQEAKNAEKRSRKAAKKPLDALEITRQTHERFTCNECGDWYVTKSKLVRHIQRHHFLIRGEALAQLLPPPQPPRPSTRRHPRHHCPHCPYTTYNSGNLRTHVRTHTGEKPFKCSECDFRCSQKVHLEGHLRTHTGEKPFECPFCDYKSNRKSHLNLHLRTHTGEKPFQCTQCKFRCTDKSNLKNHLRTHTGEKPFKCAACDCTFAQRGDLIKHKRTHTGEKPFQCPECDSKFSDTGNLKKHMRIHTGEKPFKCTECNFECARKGGLRNHLRIHTGEKPFKCDTCDYSCANSYSLHYHKKKHVRKSSRFL